MTSTSGDIHKCRTEDVREVPDAFVQRLVDTRKVDFALSNGVRYIPGIYIEEEDE